MHIPRLIALLLSFGHLSHGKQTPVMASYITLFCILPDNCLTHISAIVTWVHKNSYDFHLALQCYACSGSLNKDDSQKYNSRCIRPTKDQVGSHGVEPNRQHLVIVPNCVPSTAPGMKAFCYMSTNKTDKRGLHIRRGCASIWEYKEPTCFEGHVPDTDDVDGKACLCDKDLCNDGAPGSSATKLPFSPQPWLLTPFFGALKFLGLI